MAIWSAYHDDECECVDVLKVNVLYSSVSFSPLQYWMMMFDLLIKILKKGFRTRLMCAFLIWCLSWKQMVGWRRFNSLVGSRIGWQTYLDVAFKVPSVGSVRNSMKRDWTFPRVTNSLSLRRMVRSIKIEYSTSKLLLSPRHFALAPEPAACPVVCASKAR